MLCFDARKERTVQQEQSIHHSSPRKLPSPRAWTLTLATDTILIKSLKRKSTPQLSGEKGGCPEGVATEVTKASSAERLARRQSQTYCVVYPSNARVGDGWEKEYPVRKVQMMIIIVTGIPCL